MAVLSRQPLDGTYNRWDFTFVAQMQAAQTSGNWGEVALVTQSLSDGHVYLLTGLFGGAYSLVVFVSDTLRLNVVSILGTRSNWQLAAEILSTQLVPWMGDEGQIGAYYLYDMLFVVAAIGKRIDPSYPTVFMGHSLGGATAEVLAAYAANSQGRSVQAVYTLGAPKPGDATFASFLKVPVLRLENTGDIVPSLAQNVSGLSAPANRLFLLLKGYKALTAGSYVQLGTPYTMNAEGLVTPGHYEYAPLTIAGVLLNGDISPHYNSEYLRRLLLNSFAPGELVPYANGYEKPWILAGLNQQPLAVPANTQASYALQDIRPVQTTFLVSVDRLGNALQTQMVNDMPPQSWVPILGKAGRRPACCP